MARLGPGQKALYEAIRTWLQNQGFQAFVTGNKMKFVIPVSDLISAPYKVPDLIGVKDLGALTRVVIVEVEKDRKRLFDAVGRCLLWRCIATFVYLAFPENAVPERAPFLSRIGLGLLAVDAEWQTVREVVSLPREVGDFYRVTELHPTDPKREMELADHIRSALQ